MLEAYLFITTAFPILLPDSFSTVDHCSVVYCMVLLGKFSLYSLLLFSSIFIPISCTFSASSTHIPCWRCHVPNMWMTTGLTTFGVMKHLAGSSLPSMLIRLVGIVSWMAAPHTFYSQRCKVIAAKPVLTTKEGKKRNLHKIVSWMIIMLSNL